MMVLSGKNILITRQPERVHDLVEEIEQLGGKTVTIPLISILDPESWDDCDQAIDALALFDGIAFTSVNAVEKFMGRCALKGVPAGGFYGRSIYAVGEKTQKALTQHDVIVSFTPQVHSSRALADFFKKRNVRGKRFLLPKGNLAKEDLPNALRSCGAIVRETEVYVNRSASKPELDAMKERLILGEFDAIVFASPSAVENFASVVSPGDFAPHADRTKIAVIGATTRDAVIGRGFHADIVAHQSTNHGLVESLRDYYRVEHSIAG